VAVMHIEIEMRRRGVVAMRKEACINLIKVPNKTGTIN